MSNKQPIYYMQTDPKWQNNDYSAKGEKTTIGRSGCGVTCAAMIIATLTGKKITPADTAEWALKRGYKAPNQGTYYSYFKPQMAAYGIDCYQLNTSNLYGNYSSTIHERAFELVKEGCWLIACMGVGTWTTSGHYIVVWDVNDKVRINDPISKRDIRINGNIEAFKRQVKYYWAIDARNYNRGDDLTQEQFNQMFAIAMKEYRKSLQTNDASAWSQDARNWAISTGLIQGGTDNNYMWRDFPTREQLVTVLYRNEKK